VSFYLPPAAAEAVHARVVGARTEYAACIEILIRKQMTGMGPVQDTLRGFHLYPEAAARRLMRELEPILRQRSEVEDD